MNQRIQHNFTAAHKTRDLSRNPVFLSSLCPGAPAVSNCNLCGGPSSLICPSCDNQSFCDACDDLFHRHPSRANHKRDKIHKTKQGMCQITTSLKTETYQRTTAEAKRLLLLPLTCFVCVLCVCVETCSICGVSPGYAQCSTCVQKLCRNCDMLFHSHPDRKGHSRTIITPAKTSR